MSLAYTLHVTHHTARYREWSDTFHQIIIIAKKSHWITLKNTPKPKLWDRLFWPVTFDLHGQNLRTKVQFLFRYTKILEKVSQGHSGTLNQNIWTIPLSSILNVILSSHVKGQRYQITQSYLEATQSPPSLSVSRLRGNAHPTHVNKHKTLGIQFYCEMGCPS